MATKFNPVVEQSDEFTDVDDVNVVHGLIKSEIHIRNAVGNKTVFSEKVKWIYVNATTMFVRPDGEYNSMSSMSTLYEFSTVHVMLPTKIDGRVSVVVKKKRDNLDGKLYFTIEINKTIYL